MDEWTGTAIDGLIRLWDKDLEAVANALDAEFITVDSVLDANNWRNRITGRVTWRPI